MAMPSTYASESRKPLALVSSLFCPAMMPERIGIIGNTHGVSASSRPKPKKVATTAQKLPPFSTRSIFEVSDSLAAGFVASGVADAAAPLAAPPATLQPAVREKSCLIGG